MAVDGARIYLFVRGKGIVAHTLTPRYCLFLLLHDVAPSLTRNYQPTRKVLK